MTKITMKGEIQKSWSRQWPLQLFT